MADILRMTREQYENDIRSAMETAWDEGFDKGFYDPLAGRTPQRDACESNAENPYSVIP